jgi:hypothetical protein
MMATNHTTAFLDELIVSEAGDVPNSELGIGYDADALERQAELDELAEVELATGGAAPAGDLDDDDLLPDEAPVVAAPPVAAPHIDAARAAAMPDLTAKLVRTFLFAALGALVTAILPIIDTIASGGNVDLSVLGSFAVAGIAGAVAAGARAGVALLPVYADDAVGLRRPGKKP